MEPITLSSLLILGSLASAVATLVVLVLTGLERRTRYLPVARAAIALIDAVLVGVTFGRAAAWLQAVNTLAGLSGLSALALALATPRPLVSWTRSRDAASDPDWWQEFERSFWRYVDAPRVDPLRAATTRLSARDAITGRIDRPTSL